MTVWITLSHVAPSSGPGNRWKGLSLPPFVGATIWPRRSCSLGKLTLARRVAVRRAILLKR